MLSKERSRTAFFGPAVLARLGRVAVTLARFTATLARVGARLARVAARLAALGGCLAGRGRAGLGLVQRLVGRAEQQRRRVAVAWKDGHATADGELRTVGIVRQPLGH